MKGIGIRLLLVGFVSLTAGCSVAPEESMSAAVASREATVATASVRQAGEYSGSHVPLVRCGFTVRDLRAIRDEYGRVHVLGEVQNVGAAARGVELQAALRDADGRLLSVGHFCPAAGNNIVPGEMWPFTYSFGKQDQGVRAELRIVDAFRSMGDPDP